MSSSTPRLLAGLGRRVGQLVAVTVIVTVLTFAFVHLIPGDPAITILGLHATPENLAALRTELGIDRPLIEQFQVYVTSLLQGDLGTSIATSRPVISMVVPAFGVTFGILLAAVVFSTVLGVAAGLTGALSPAPAVDRTIRIVGMVLLATPTFLIGLLLIALFAVRLGVLPAGGWGTPQSMVLPVLALAGLQAPLVARAVRASVLEAVGQSFVYAAVSRGLGRRRVILGHILPNSLLPVITVVGFTVAGLVGGSAIIEAVFAIPGIGSLLVSAVTARDYPVIQGVTLLTAILVVLINFLTDVIYAVVDPRTRRVAH